MSRLLPPLVVAVLLGHAAGTAAADVITTISPPCGSIVPAPVTLVVDNPSPTAVPYRFEVYSDAGLTLPVATVSVAQGPGSTTSTPVTPASPPVWFAATTYYWRVVAPGVMESNRCHFQVGNGNRPPPAPTPAGPPGPAVPTTTPALTVHNVLEPDGDVVRYELQVWADPALSSFVAGTGGCVVPEGAMGTTSWVTTPLVEDHFYYWRARACDAYGQLGPWSQTQAVAIDTVNVPPAVPTLVSPANLAIVDQLRPPLVLLAVDDPDPEPTVYDWQLADDASFAALVAAGVDEPASGPQLATFRLPADLVEDHRYCWRARADDGQATSAWATACFLVSTGNDPPTVPVPNNPSDAMGATTTTPVFSWQPSTDPEGDGVAYDLEVGDDDGLVGAVGGVNATVTSIATELANRGHYAWRVRAVDDQGAASAWSADTLFVVDAPVDDPDVAVSSGGCRAAAAPSGFLPLLLAIGLVGRHRRLARYTAAGHVRAEPLRAHPSGAHRAQARGDRIRTIARGRHSPPWAAPRSSSRSPR